MDTNSWKILAGTISTVIFVFSNSLMLFKAYRTNDLDSYSLGHLAFTNLGNLIHWVYISSLPFGPIWYLHAYYSLVAALMIFWYFRYRKGEIIDDSHRLKQRNFFVIRLRNNAHSSLFSAKKSGFAKSNLKIIDLQRGIYNCICGCLDSVWNIYAEARLFIVENGCQLLPSATLNIRFAS